MAGIDSCFHFASAPVSWGVEDNYGPAWEQPFEKILDEMVAGGFTGTELGPYGYFPSEPEAIRPVLERKKLAMLSSFVPVSLADPASRTAVVEHIRKVIALWKKRFVELRGDPRIRYVYIFENRGEVIGVTMPHPHGQIYSFPYVPPRVERELESVRQHHAETGRCLFCDILAEERRDGRRIVEENEHFTAFVPFFARWPYEVHVLARAHLETIDQLSDPQEQSLAELLKHLLLRYDHLFGFPLPLMMVIHQSPVNGNSDEKLHFHFEFYPPHRSAKKLKYLAGVEQGAGTFLNDTSAEEKAAELRASSPDL